MPHLRLEDKKTSTHYYLIRMLAISILIITWSCSDKNGSTIFIGSKDHFSESATNLENIFTPLMENQYNRYSFTQIYNDSLLFGMNSFINKTKIDVINLLEPKKSYAIKLKEKEFSVYPSSFFIHNIDSIFLLQPSSKEISLINSSGELIEKFDFNKPILEKYELLEFLPLKPIFHDGNLYVNVRPIGLLENSDFLSLPQFLQINTLTNELLLLGEMNSIAAYLGNNEVNTDFYSPYYQVINSNLLILYPFYPFLIQINLDSPKSTPKFHPIKSQYVEKTSPLASSRIHEDQFLNATYRSSITTFSDLNFHEESKLISIIFMHPFESLSAEGRLKSWNSRESSLIIMDTSFAITSEIKFSNGELLMNASIPFSSSLRIANSIENEKIEDSLHYYRHIDFSKMSRKH